MITHDVPVSNCPACRKTLDAATGAGVEEVLGPEPGSYSLCWGCGSILVFDQNLALRLATASEVLELHGSEKWPLVKRIIGFIHKRNEDDQKVAN